LGTKETGGSRQVQEAGRTRFTCLLPTAPAY
jgi:hypothetical protein